jgi:type II secretory pathway component GspD/PulD (secretin)
MRFKLHLLTVCVLMAGAVFSQEDFESVDDIMNELMEYEEDQTPYTAAAVPASPRKDPEAIRQPDDAPPATEGDVRTTEPDMQVEQKGLLQSGGEDTSAAAGTDERFQAAPVQHDSDDVSAVTEADKTVQEENVLTPEDVELLILARALSMDMEEVIQLIDNARDQEKETLRALQDLADMIKNDPGPEAAMGKQPRNHKTAEIRGMEAVDAAWSTDLMLRSFTLLAGAGKRMKLSDTTRAVSVESFFSVVDFPKGASAIYQPETETIYITNTRENLDVLESMLGTMGVLRGFGYADQVEIEAKFVEVSEGTLEELGFQWNFEPDPAPMGADYEFNDGPDGLFSDSLRGNPVPFDRKIDLGDGTVAPSGAWSTFRFVDGFSTEPGSLGFENQGRNQFEVLLTALDQSSGTDVLSAPRILTRSGEEASIQVGEIHYFPEVFEGDAAQATIVNVSYEDFKEELLGVQLTVTPKVNDEREIMLELNPRITELAGYQSYQLLPGSFDLNPSPGFTTFKGSHYNHRQLETSKAYTEHDAIVGSLPIFKIREIETQLTMADGSTIGMGGLINEKIEKFDDRVPVVGSIPFVGRLFRNEGERVVKRNLLMFVTANIIDPNGRVDSSRSFE